MEKQTVAGRFLKVTILAKPGCAKPSWYLPAALGKSVAGVSVDELFKGLQHLPNACA